MILLVSPPDEPHGRAIGAEIARRGEAVSWFDHADFPTATGISLWASNGRVVRRAHLLDETEVVDLDSVTAVWWWPQARPVVHRSIRGDRERRFVEQTSELFLWDLWQTLDVPWVPGTWPQLARAQNKMSQLQSARRTGFEIPPTLVTTSPADFVEFYRKHGGNVISKIVHSQAWKPLEEDEPLGYTRVVSRRDVGYAHTVRHCPTLFQAYVPKHLELRVTVVGRQVFAAEIDSQRSNRSRDDWRRHGLAGAPYRPHRLPAEIERQCGDLLDVLGVTFGAIDMILTPDGRHVFLEINTLGGGAWLWAEELTGSPITATVCDMLLEGPRAERGATDVGAAG